MTRKRTTAWTAAAAVFALQPGTDQAIGDHPHNKANHYPKFGDGPSN